MAVLTTKKRNDLPESAFAIPEKRAYPIHDKAHARNALARVAQYGTPDEKRRVHEAVKKKFPGIGDPSTDDEMPMHEKMSRWKTRKAGGKASMMEDD